MALKKNIVKIATPLPLRRPFYYSIPDTLNQDSLLPGMRVKVPLGPRKIIGFYMGPAKDNNIPENKLKDIIEIIDDKPIFSDTILQLCKWASAYYQRSLGDVFANALPVNLRQGKKAIVHHENYWELSEKSRSIDDTSLKRAPQQLALFRFLKNINRKISQSTLTNKGFKYNTIIALLNKKLIQSTEPSKKVFDTPEIPSFQLNKAQLEAIQQINNNSKQFQCFLLNGITGSGKTEVYLNVIQNILKQGKQALILVPEIGLTPQTIQRFQKRFQVQTVSFHSGLNNTERLNAWVLAKTGEAKIIIGTRSAIFTSCKNLGIIIIDEEHDLSFKQQEGFRYSARDLAIVRANIENIPIILGSATPSFETLYNTMHQRYQTLLLPERVGRAIHPRFHFIDIRNCTLKHGLSKTLLKVVDQHIQQDNQVLLFLNRRGYAPTLMCHKCGWISTCNHCDAHLTLHQQPPHLRCHHCNMTRRIPILCPKCKNTHLQNIGVGTERLEKALKKHFPDTQIIRIDRDTTSRKNAMNTILKQIENGQKQILIGTQMIAKGHHFPNVTMVGIINGDSGFFSADFRTTERMGQLLMQVAGRAGRAEKPGEVFIQTHYPEHPLLLKLTQEGYMPFAEQMLTERQESQLPPFSHFILFRAQAPKKTLSEEFLNQVKTVLIDATVPEIKILGPIPSPMEKQKGCFHSQLLLQAKNRTSLQKLLTDSIPKIEALKSATKVKWSIDVDPLDMS